MAEGDGEVAMDEAQEGEEGTGEEIAPAEIKEEIQQETEPEYVLGVLRGGFVCVWGR